jgi:hypothetical protein
MSVYGGKMSAWELLQTSLLVVSIVSLLLLWQTLRGLRTQLASTTSDLIKLVDKQSALLVARTPIDYQAIRSVDEFESQEYDPSDEGELARIARRNNALYNSGEAELQRIDVELGEYGGDGGGNPFLLSP